MNKMFYKIILFVSFILSNEAPEWTVIPDQSINEDCHQINNCIGFPINLNNYVSDPDGDQILISYLTIDSIDINIDENLFLSVIPNNDFFTVDIPIEIQLDDSDG